MHLVDKTYNTPCMIKKVLCTLWYRHFIFWSDSYKKWWLSFSVDPVWLKACWQRVFFWFRRVDVQGCDEDWLNGTTREVNLCLTAFQFLVSPCLPHPLSLTPLPQGMTGLYSGTQGLSFDGCVCVSFDSDDSGCVKYLPIKGWSPSLGLPSVFCSWNW